MKEELESNWEMPEYFFSTILTYIHSNHKEEFESLPEDNVIHIPVVGGEYRVSKKDLLIEAKKELANGGK